MKKMKAAFFHGSNNLRLGDRSDGVLKVAIKP